MNAPEYTQKEKLKIFLPHALWVVPAILILQFYVIPWYKGFSENAHCETYLNFNGAYFVFFILFSIPVISSVLIGFLCFKENLQILKLAQYPLPNKKVYIPTKYVYGIKARIKAYCLFSIIALQFLVGFGGMFWSFNYVTANLEIYQNKCSS